MKNSKRYLITSFIGLVILWITYLAGFWPLAIIIFPLVWGGIFSLTVYFDRKRE